MTTTADAPPSVLLTAQQKDGIQWTVLSSLLGAPPRRGQPRDPTFLPGGRDARELSRPAAAKASPSIANETHGTPKIPKFPLSAQSRSPPTTQAGSGAAGKSEGLARCRTRPPFENRYNHSMTAAGSEVILFGGRVIKGRQEFVTGEMHAYCTTSSSWRCVTPHSVAPASRAGHSVVCWRGRLHMFGGENGLRPTGDFWTYHPQRNIWALRRPDQQTRPSARAHHTAVMYGDRMYVFGGTGRDVSGAVWIFDMVAKRWSVAGRDLTSALSHSSAVAPEPRAHHSAVVVGDWMYLFGGKIISGPAAGKVTAEMWRFHLVLHKWERVHPRGAVPGGRQGHAALRVGRQEWIVHGGCLTDAQSAAEGRASVMCFDVKTNCWRSVRPRLDALKRRAPRWGHALVAVRPPRDAGPTAKPFVMTTGGCHNAFRSCV